MVTSSSAYRCAFWFMAIFVLSLVFMFGCWAANAVKLASCDFDENGSWRGEIIHAIGIIPPAALVTVWFNDK